MQPVLYNLVDTGRQKEGVEPGTPVNLGHHQLGQSGDVVEEVGQDELPGFVEADLLRDLPSTDHYPAHGGRATACRSQSGEEQEALLVDGVFPSGVIVSDVSCRERMVNSRGNGMGFL